MSRRPEPVESPQPDEVEESLAEGSVEEPQEIEPQEIEEPEQAGEAEEVEAEATEPERAEPEPAESEPAQPDAPTLEPVRRKPAARESVQTVGRRKEAVARVLLRPGKGEIRVNGRHFEEYFPVLRHRSAVEQPFKATDTEGLYDARIRAGGGGLTGQAEAAQLGVARALLEFDDERRAALRAHGLLTRDPRAVERKKPGQPKARKQFQFSKR